MERTPIGAPDGSVTIAASWNAPAPGDVEVYLAVISADGERCTRYAVSAGPEEPLFRHWGAIHDFQIDAAGRLYGTALKQHANEHVPNKIDEAFGGWRLPAD